MTPIGVTILLHYYYSNSDFRDGDFSAPAIRELIDSFYKVDDLLESTNNQENYCYRITARGKAYIDHLCSIPLPICKWEIPCK